MRADWVVAGRIGLCRGLSQSRLQIYCSSLSLKSRRQWVGVGHRFYGSKVVCGLTHQDAGVGFALPKTPSLSLRSYSFGHIDCGVSTTLVSWIFTRFYGNPHVHMCNSSGDLLHNLRSISVHLEEPWLIGGISMKYSCNVRKMGGS